MDIKAEDQAAFIEAEKCAAVANAVLEAQRHDPIRCSIGVASMAVNIAHGNPTATTALARYMLYLIRHELDYDVLAASVH